MYLLGLDQKNWLGNLQRVISERGDILWVCEAHAASNQVQEGIKEIQHIITANQMSSEVVLDSVTYELRLVLSVHPRKFEYVDFFHKDCYFFNVRIRDLDKKSISRLGRLVARPLRLIPLLGLR